MKQDDFIDVTTLTANEATAAIREGRLTSEELVSGCLARIRADEPRVQAWAHLDEEHALRQARARDADRKAGHTVGPLHGVPIGVKDIIDTADMPTEDGTVLHAGRRPEYDAHVVTMLREAGAVILGKTVTTELATYAPGKTRNPHNPEHTPGGSSSGSAAAVAAQMVPAALGTQTNGSVIRPAAYCGVYGFKPTFGRISLALVAECLMGYDEHDPDTRMAVRPRLLEVATADVPVPPRFAFAKTPNWADADAQTHAAFEELAQALGAQCEWFTVPAEFAGAWEWHRLVMEADIARNYRHDYERGRDRLSESLRGQIERGRLVTAVDYNDAVDRIEAVSTAFDELFVRYDAILTASTAGTAPRGLASTGSPAFCTLWTFAGMPAVTLPLMRGEDGLPLGVQLVGIRGDDARLLRTARWLAQWASQPDE
jgi:Asp-tRNA(Asn)/Glu-tRNA(Gln) amidotransferase A subunit family amidase